MCNKLITSEVNNEKAILKNGNYLKNQIKE